MCDERIGEATIYSSSAFTRVIVIDAFTFQTCVYREAFQ